MTNTLKAIANPVTDPTPSGALYAHDKLPEGVVWGTAQKTRPIRAKPLQAILVDQSVLAKFLLDTLEGTQQLKAGSIVCLGHNNDVWQQDKKKLFQQYTVTDTDEQGWMTCTPKPEAMKEAFTVTPEMCDVNGKFSLLANWGTAILYKGQRTFVQQGEVGDIIARNLQDKSDVWIVRRAFWDSTHEWVTP